MRVALIQQLYRKSKEATRKMTVQRITEASQNGAELVVLPELHQNEYFFVKIRTFW